MCNDTKLTERVTMIISLNMHKALSIERETEPSERDQRENLSKRRPMMMIRSDANKLFVIWKKKGKDSPEKGAEFEGTVSFYIPNLVGSRNGIYVLGRLLRLRVRFI